MTVMNEQKLAFRDMTKEERSEIVEAWLRGDVQYLDMCEFEDGEWKKVSVWFLTDSYIYRTAPKQLVIPWGVIKKEYKWAAISSNGMPFVTKEKPSLDIDDWYCEFCAYEMITSLNIDTTGIDWQHSLTQRPEDM